MKHRVWMALMAGSVLGGCSGQSDSLSSNTGGGIEIPNGLAVTVKTAAGAPLPGAVVRRVAAERWCELQGGGNAVVRDSAVTDASGRASLSWEEGVSAWLEVEADSARGLRRQISDSGSVSVNVSALDSLTGTWPDALDLPSRLYLVGTSRSAVPSASRRFDFGAVPPGNYVLVARIDTSYRLAGTAQVAAAGNAFTASADTSWLLDDFEDEDISWNLAAVLGEGYWWRLNQQRSDTAIGAESGNHYFRGTNPGASLWNFGLTLVSCRPSLANFRALSLTARGSGSWIVLLNALDSLGNDIIWQDTLAVDSSWRTFSLTDFSLVSGLSSGTAEFHACRLKSIVFQTDGAGTLDVDEVRLTGPRPGDWKVSR